MPSSVLQRLLMGIYGAAERRGVLAHPRVRTVFEASYSLYKERVEAPYLAALQPYIEPGTVVIDVGANIGVFTRRFAEWTGPDGCVLALEPEAKNFERLAAMVARRGLTGRVVPVQAVAAEHSGELTLRVDPHHPGGHHLAPEGVMTRAVTIDGLMHSQSLPVSFIKIDVQGAELRVLAGAVTTLATARPNLLVEIDEPALQSMGASTRTVIDFLVSRGYRGRAVSARGIEGELEPAALEQRCLAADDYLDLLFTHDAAP